MQRSEQINEIAAAMAKAQAEIEGATRDRENPAFRSKYADLGAVWDAIRAPLSANNIAVVQFPRIREGGGIEVETMMMHSSGQWMSEVLGMPVTKADQHGHGSSITYARRFALSSMCGVAPVDLDGNDEHAGTKGMANGGGDFRPAGPRRFVGPVGTQAAKDEAARDGLISEPKPPAPKVVAPPTKKQQWCATAIEMFKAMNTSDELKAWWKTEKARLGVIETELPADYERLLEAYDEAMDRTGAVAA